MSPPEPNLQDNHDMKWNLSFAGCGFLGLYHAGVGGCIQEYAPHLFKNQKISGASAGAIAAACMLCEVNLGECVHYLMQVVNKAQSYTLGPFDPRFKITEHVREGLERMLPLNAHIMCSGLLHISMTSQSSGENVIVNQFKSRDELIRAILCSSYIPIFSGFIPLSFRGEWMIDGGVTNNIPELDRYTITVSPFCGDADICPRDDWGLGHIYFANTSLLVNYENLRRILCIVWPKTPAELAKLTQQGYNDTLKFLVRQGLISCTNHNRRLVFMTVRVKASGCAEGCHHCKAVLRRALNSSVPDNVLRSIHPNAQGTGGQTSWLGRVVKSRLLRALRLLAAPATLPMGVIYNLVLGALKSLSLVPCYLKPMFSQLQITLTALETVFKRAYAASSRAERAAILCRSLNDLELGLKIQKEPAPPLDTPITMETESDEATKPQEVPLTSIREEGSATEDDELAIHLPVSMVQPELKRLLLNTGDPVLVDQLDEGLVETVEIESMSKIDLTNDFDQGFADDEADASSVDWEEDGRSREEMSDSEFIVRNTEELAELVLDSSSHMAWSYRDFEGSEDIKMFMVVPIPEKEVMINVADDMRPKETTSLGSSPVDTDFSIDS